MSHSIEKSRLLGHWIHSDEEDQGDEIVLRTKAHAFPPRRAPRKSLTLDASGAAHTGTPGPADRNVQSPGLWTLAEDRLTVTGAGPLAGRFRIVSVDEDKLVLRRTP